MWSEKFLEMGRGITIITLMSEERNLVLNPLRDRKPMKGCEDGSDMIVLAHPH